MYCQWAHRRAITVEGDNDDKARDKKLTFKNNAVFKSYMSK